MNSEDMLTQVVTEIPEPLPPKSHFMKINAVAYVIAKINEAIKSEQLVVIQDVRSQIDEVGSFLTDEQLQVIAEKYEALDWKVEVHRAGHTCIIFLLEG